MIPAFDIKLIKRKYALRNKLLMMRTRALARSLEGVSGIDQAQLKEFIFWYPWKDHPLINLVYGPFYDSIFDSTVAGTTIESLSDLVVLTKWSKKIHDGKGMKFRQEITLKLKRLEKAMFLGMIPQRHFSAYVQKKLTKLFSKIQKGEPELIDLYRQVLKETNTGRFDL